MAGKCGNCTACCRVYAIPQLEKPGGKWCQHCAIGVGCQVYNDRPKICQTFECLWLQSQSIPGAELEAELRPDRCKIVFAPTTNERVIHGMTMPGTPLAYERKDVRAFIDRLIKTGVVVAIGLPAGRRQTMLGPNGTRREIEMTAPDKNGMQWSINHDKGV